jgi:hypothetical protein
MADIGVKFSGRKGHRKGAIGFEFEFEGMDELMRALSGAGLPHEIKGIAGFNTPYALAQHERLDYHHPKGGKAKYLEGPLKENVGRYASRMGLRMKRAIVGPAIAGAGGHVLAAAVLEGAIDGMIEATEDLLGRAMREAPIDEGTLRASGTATVYVDGRPVSGMTTKQVVPAAPSAGAAP